VSVKIAEKMARVRPYGERRIALGPGVVWFSNPDLGTGLCFPIKRLGYRARLSGPAGHVEALLSFINPTTQTQEAYFLFPLDRHIAPVKMMGKVGNRKIEMEVGPPPGEDSETVEADLPSELCLLFQEETENVLAIPLGEIPSGGEVSFQILLAYTVLECGEAGSGFSFRLPLLVSQALTTLNSNDEQKLMLATGLDRGAQVAVSIQIEASDLEPTNIVTSQVCGVARNPKGDLAVEYDKRKPLEVRDFVVDYHLWSGNRPKAWLRSTGRHFLLNFLPPGQAPPSQPRRLVILVDGSEEMNKVGIDRAGDCLSTILKNLDPVDKFALVAFNREVAGYKNGDFVEANCADEAIDWLANYQFEGGADLKELLRRVVTLPRQADSVLSVILVMAGRIGNEPELYRLIHGSRDILRLFPIMLGFRSDAHFARAASRLTGGYAFRALTQESVSRVAERVLEHTRQPVLEGVGLQDKGIQYQGDSLTPKYPTGLNWRRPITVMGAHGGRGGIEAGGAGPSGAVWSEFLELKPAFHKLLPNVWAHIKSSELDDEAQMLDRTERGLLQKVILNLSREFRLLNRYTAAYIRDASGQVLAPSIDASSWYKKIEKEASQSRTATELLEKQRTAKDFAGGMSKQRNPGRGLTMKDVLGSKSTAAIFGSKLGHRNKLSPSIKEGIFSKPVLTSRQGGRVVATASAESKNGGVPSSPPTYSPSENRFSHDAPTLLEAPTAKLGPPPPEISPTPAVDLSEPSSSEFPVESYERPDPVTDIPKPPANLDEPIHGNDELPTTEKLQSPIEEFAPLEGVSESDIPRTEKLSPAPEVEEDEDDFATPERPAVVRDADEPRLPRINIQPEVAEEEVVEAEIKETFLPRPGGEAPKEDGPESAGSEPDFSIDPEVPSIAKPVQGSPAPIAEPAKASAPIPAPDPPAPVEVEAKKLPTPRELASNILPEARQGQPEEVAKNALRSDPALRKQLMMEMRALHGSLAAGDAEKLKSMTQSVLFLLADVAPKSELLVKAYHLGFQAIGMIDGNLNDAKGKLKFWLTRFAKLF
jgi:VWA domain-containing protein/vault protein inter-alpha-trypsin-like protein